MRGSKIAKQIEYELKREARRKAITLELRRRLKERGESNEYKCSNKQTTDGVVGKEHPSKIKY